MPFQVVLTNSIAIERKKCFLQLWRPLSAKLDIGSWSASILITLSICSSFLITFSLELMSLNPMLILSGYWLLTERRKEHLIVPFFTTFQLFYFIPSAPPFLHLYHQLKCLLSSKLVWDLWNSFREPGRYWTLESCCVFFFFFKWKGWENPLCCLLGRSFWT